MRIDIIIIIIIIIVFVIVKSLWFIWFSKSMGHGSLTKDFLFIIPLKTF